MKGGKKMSRINHEITLEKTIIKLSIYSICPFCNASMPDNSEILSEGYTPNSRGTYIEHGIYFVLIKCPFCESIILKLFRIKTDRATMKLSNWGIEKKQIKKSKDVVFPDVIKSISPRFITVYSQSLQSEKKNLNELSGMGYRKSLEILVKDYAIYKFPNDAESIMKNSLQHALSKIDTHEIKVLGQVATKIGNDETHYYRKHDWKVSELKNYIESIIFFISSDLNFDQASLRLSQDRGQTPK